MLIEWAPGYSFRGYEIVRELGRGGMAVVYLAVKIDSRSPENLVAIKRVLPHLAGERRFIELFLNEARLSSKLEHPNTLQVLEFGTVNGEHFMVLEYVHGVDLRDLLRDCARASGRVPLACGLYIVGAVARGLHDAHVMRGPDGVPLGLIHRDVTPSNVMVGYDGSVRLGDFGVAKALALSKTRSVSLKGKVAYMSPEQCSGGSIDRRSDVFSLGVLAWEVSTGRRLFRGGNEFQIMNQVVSGNVRRPTEEDPDYPPDLEALVVEALQADPAHRFQTAQELVDAVDQFVRNHELDASAEGLRDFMFELYGEQVPPLIMASSTRTMKPEVTLTTTHVAEVEPLPEPRWWLRPLVLGGAATLVVGSGLFIANLVDDTEAPASAPAPAAIEEPSRPAKPAAEPEAPPQSPVRPQPAGETTPPLEAEHPALEAEPEPPELQPQHKRKTSKSSGRAKSRPTKRTRLDDVELTQDDRKPSLYPPE